MRQPAASSSASGRRRAVTGIERDGGGRTRRRTVARWEGDTLVVDTTHIRSGTFMNNGLTHSEDLHLVERFRLGEDGSTLHLTQLYSDPAKVEGLAARYMAWQRDPDGYVLPYDCDPTYGE